MFLNNNDWNFTGQDISTYRKNISTGVKYPVIFILSILICFGCIFYYSAYSYELSGIVFRYFIQVLIGLAVGIVFYFSDKNILSILSPVLLVVSFICFIVFDNSSYFAFLMLLLYIAFYCSNRQNSISETLEFIYPLVLSVIFLVIAYFKQDILSVLFYAVEITLVFSVCSAGLKNILIYVGFTFVPLITLLFVNYISFSSIMDFFRFPRNSNILNTLVGSSLTGVGIGAGRIKSESVFLNFINEAGLIGIIIYVSLLFIILFIGIRYVSLYKYFDTFKSNLIYIATLFIVLNSAIPVLNKLYVVPVFDLSIPFFESDFSLSSIIISFFFFIKCFRSEKESQTNDLALYGESNVKD